jgi:hypothetical protein
MHFNAAIAVVLAGVLVSPAVPAQEPDVEVTNLTPRRVSYPKGPSAKVRNRTRAVDLQAWVIRHLDDVIVKRYAIPPIERWSEELQIVPRDDALPTRVSSKDTLVPFALIVVNGEGHVKVSMPFEVRVSPPSGGWSRPFAAQQPTMNQFVASGEVTAFKSIAPAPEKAAGWQTGKGSAELLVKDTQGQSRKFIYTNDTKVWGEKAWDAPVGSKSPAPSEGDTVSMIYSGRGGVDVVTQIWYKTASPVMNPWEGLQFYIGTVKGVATSPLKPGALFLETIKFGMAGRWLVVNPATSIFAAGALSPDELKPGRVAALGVKPGALPPPPVPVERVILLSDTPR